MSESCYFPIKGLDDVLAERIGYPINRIAGYRTLYEEKTKEKITTENFEKLVEFIASVNEAEEKEVTRRAKLSKPSTESKIYRSLKSTFSPSTLQRRIDAISSIFSAIVTDYEKENPGYSRADIIKSIGFSNIILEVKDYLDGLYRAAKENNNTERMSEYQKIFDNWDALIFMTQSYLKTYESLVFSQNIDFVEEANESNFGDNDMSSRYILEESVREHWMNNTDFISAFGSLGKEVRRAISRIKSRDSSGEIERDDLGIPIYLSPNTVHNILSEIFRNVTTSEQMMNVLNSYSENAKWAKDLYKLLLDNPILRTQFFVDLYKNFQAYSIQYVDSTGKTRTKILNKSSGKTLYSKYKSNIVSGNISNNSIFSKISSDLIGIDFKKLKSFKDLIKDLFVIEDKDIEEYKKQVELYNNQSFSLTGTPIKRPKKPTLSFYNRYKTIEQQIVALYNILSSLNVEADMDVLNAILSNKKDTKNLFDALTELANYGLKITNPNITAEGILSEENFSEKMEKIFSILSRYNNGILSMESRVRFQGNSYSSNVSPSYMGDFFGYIQNCVQNGDTESLRIFLKNKFLSNEVFSYNDEIFNTWLEDLYNSDLEDSDSFASSVTWHKGLAYEDILFEDLSSNKHLEYLMTEYNSIREQSGQNIVYISQKDFDVLEDKKDKSVVYVIEGTNDSYKFQKGNGWVKSTRKDYGYYPVFILGDANVAKFIKARRYSFNEIVQGLYGTFKSELRRQENTKDILEKWEKAGVKPNKNMQKNKDRFTMLPFLNADFENGKYYNIATINGKFTESSVKQAIASYLRDKAEEFSVKTMQKKGVTENSRDSEDSFNKDFFYNTYFATCQQLQLMTVDVAFYDNIKDLQKRYKEIHAPGSILDIDALDVWSDTSSPEKVSDGIERCVYIDDAIIDTEKSNPKMFDILKKRFNKENDWRPGEYNKSNSTDGQGWRTIHSYRKVMIMSGKWNESFESAYQGILTIKDNMQKEGRTSPTEEELDYLEELQVVFQPIKPYLYGFEHIEGSNLDIPVQHKYAEIVIIPELLPAGSKLREMAEHMEQNGIDVVLASSAVKVGGYGSAKSIEDLPNATIHKLSYSDYRIQTNVPEHVHQSRLFGTQFRKLILSNLRRDDYSDYTDGKSVVILEKDGPVNMTKYNLVRFYNSLVVANILDSFEEFKRKTNNSYKLSASAIYQLINNDRNIKDDIEAMSVDEFGKFILPLTEGSIEHDAAALLFSIYKKLVNKQKILGGSAVQASDFGISGVEGENSLKYVVDEEKDNILYAECEIPFNFSYVDNSGNEVKLKFTDYCNTDGTFKMDGNVTKIEKEFPGILDIIAYRIPTERAYSMMNLKVVRCSHPLAGGTIKTPAQGTTIAGFDFDIDKLYFMRKEFRQKTRKEDYSDKDKSDIWDYIYEKYPDIKAALSYAKGDSTGNLNSFWDLTTLSLTYDKDELFNDAAKELGKIDSGWDEYSYDKSPFEQSVTARNNMILELSRRRLMDVETFEERYTPGGFKNPSKAARLMRELKFSDMSSHINGKSLNLSDAISSINFSDKDSDPEPNYDPCDITTIVTYNQLNQVAGKLIGIMANQNAHHNFISVFEECSLESPIAFGSHNEKGLRDLLHSPKGAEDAFLSVAELLASSVDAVKDPVLNYLNLNTITADSGALLARLGYSFEDIGLLFNQPAIIRLCEYCFDNNTNYIAEAIKVVAAEYGVSDISKISKDSSILTQERMAYNITASSKGMEIDKATQIQALLLFQEIQAASAELSQFILNSKFTAANSVSSTFGAAYEKQQRATQFVEGLSNPQRLLNIKVNKHSSPLLRILENSVELGSDIYLEQLLINPMAYEQCMLDCNNATLSSFNEYTPYEISEYKGVRRTLSEYTKNKILTEETINSVHRELPVYLLQTDERSFLNPIRAYSKDPSISVKEYYLNHYPKELAKTLQENPFLKDLVLFKYLMPTIKDGVYKISPQDIGGISAPQVEIIRGELVELYRDEEYKSLVEDLFKYSFFTTGFNFNHNSLVNLFPTEFKTSFIVATDYEGNGITYSQYIDEIKSKRHQQINVDDFAVKYCLNHTDNRDLVYYPKGRMLARIKGLISEEDPGHLTINTSSFKGWMDTLIIGITSDDVPIFRPFINIEGDIYMADPRMGMNEGPSVTYTKVQALGDGVNSLNYNTSTKRLSSESVDNKKDKTNGVLPLDFDPSKYSEDEINRMFEIELDKVLQEVKIRGLANGDYLSEQEADTNIAAIKDMHLSASMKDKIETLKSLAVKRANELRDATGKKSC